MSLPPLDPVPIASSTGVAVAVVLIAVAVLAGIVRARRARAASPALAAIDDAALILHASQTGTARGLAQESGELLRQAGRAVRVRPLGSVTDAQALAHRHVLLVVSTTGDGDAPDDARPFVQALLDARAARRPALAGVSFGVLAFGDRRYDDFCGFGRRVDHWMARRGARRLFERIEIDGDNAEGLARWQAGLALVAGASVAPAWRDAPAPESRPWRLVHRRVLNPGSVGEPMIHVELEPADGGPPPAWEAGDLARVLVPRVHWPRDYSIASVPADGRLHLVLRRIRRRNGQPGAASGWLADAALGSELAVRLVAHPSFRIGDNAGRPLVLVGNGAGIAGLRGHLRARAGRPGARHWLLFGERQRAHDFLFQDEIEAGLAHGTLERADLAFSRDEAARPYVQDRLRDVAGPLRDWVADGAAIYVCGSRQGMAEGVHDALVEVLGEPLLEELAAAGRYRRDVY